MPSLPPDLDFSADKNANPARMNRAMLWIYTQILALQAPRKSLDDLLAQLQAVGFDRIDEAIQPLYLALATISSAGVLFNATSATPVALAPGQRVSFVLSEADRLRFAFTGFVQAVSAADPSKALIGRFVSYDRPTGTLTVDVSVASGEGSPADWTIMPSLPPNIPAAVLVAGSGDVATSAETGAHVVPVTNMVTLLQLLLSTPIVEPAGSGVLWRNGDNLLLSSGD